MALVDDVRQFRLDINTRLETLEKELLDEARSIKQANIEAFDEVRKWTEKIDSYLIELRARLTNLDECKQNRQLFISAKRAEDKLQRLQTELGKSTHQNTDRSYEFSRNEEICNTLFKSISTLGKIRFSDTDEPSWNACKMIKSSTVKSFTHPPESEIPEDVECYANGAPEMDSNRTTKNPTDVTAIFVKKIKVSIPGDSAICWITGCTYVDKNTVAIVDHNNSSVKVFDVVKGEVICSMTRDHRPQDITYTDTGLLVMACWDGLVFIRYDGTLSLIKEIPMDCHGITYFNRKLYITVHGMYPAVKILDEDGLELKTFRHDKNKEFVFNMPDYIAVSKDGERVFVTDPYKNSVMCLNPKNDVYEIYQLDKIDTPTGLALDNEGNIFVAGANSNDIQLCTPNFECMKILLGEKDGVCDPNALAFNNANNTFCMSTDAWDRNYLYIFKLEIKT